MKNLYPNWSKKELEIYILLLCSNVDSKMTDSELELIKSKIDGERFNKLYEEFLADTEEEALEKIDYNVHRHEYSPKELAALKADIKDVFFADEQFNMKEQNFDRIMNNMLY